MKETAVINPYRRRFLATAKLAGAVAVVALLGKKASEPSALAHSPSGPEVAPGRYHETEHVRKYYYSAGLL